MSDLSQNQLKKLLHYSPKTGIFTWKVQAGCATPGDRAGCIDKTGHGYRQIQVQKTLYREHRLAFLYMTGSIPIEVDHKDHDRSNTKWDNLRQSTTHINNKNKTLSKRNTSGFNGVNFDATRGKWLVSICVNKKYIFLGRFKHKDEAISARKTANIKHGFHDNHGLANVPTEESGE